jgi:hypothetical protein
LLHKNSLLRLTVSEGGFRTARKTGQCDHWARVQSTGSLTRAPENRPALAHGKFALSFMTLERRAIRPYACISSRETAVQKTPFGVSRE